MFENNDYPETGPTPVQTMAAKSAPISKSGEVEEFPVAKTSKGETASKPPPETTTVIGSDVVFKGELIAGDEIYIHGSFEGSIARHTNNVVVGKKGRVKALVHATSITVLGEVDGDIYGDELVELMDGAKVDGNIFCSSVKIQKGAKFNGTVTMA